MHPSLLCSPYRQQRPQLQSRNVSAERDRDGVPKLHCRDLPRQRCDVFFTHWPVLEMLFGSVRERHWYDIMYSVQRRDLSVGIRRHNVLGV